MPKTKQVKVQLAFLSWREFTDTLLETLVSNGAWFEQDVNIDAKFNPTNRIGMAGVEFWAIDE